MSEPTAEPTHVTPRPSFTDRVRSVPLRIVTLVLLVLLVLLVAYQALALHSYLNQQDWLTCNNVAYGYPPDANGDPDFSKAQVKLAFSDMDAPSRATADHFNCDVEGR